MRAFFLICWVQSSRFDKEKFFNNWCTIWIYILVLYFCWNQFCRRMLFRKVFYQNFVLLKIIQPRIRKVAKNTLVLFIIWDLHHTRANTTSAFGRRWWHFFVVDVASSDFRLNKKGDKFKAFIHKFFRKEILLLDN